MMLQPTAQKLRCFVSHLSKHKQKIVPRLYSTAIMREVPSTMAKALSMSSPVKPISVPNAKSQHEKYLTVMERMVLPETVLLAADDHHPDCVFVEDTAVVIDDRAVICRIGADSRRGEVDAIKESLLGLGLKVQDMRNDTENATCDGGDVLYPVSYRWSDSDGMTTKMGGKYLFVGISSRTNYNGADYLQSAFPNVEVIPIEMRETNWQALHLKSIVTHIDEETLVMPKGKEWDYICDLMDVEGRGLEVVRLPDMAACNVVSANGHVLAQSDICNESKEILKREVEQNRGQTLIYVEASEFAKCDGALTCKSILIP